MMLHPKDLKAVILAGGLGSRLAEETDRIPKPLVKVGDYPILWHIMKIFAFYGVTEFFVCLGYKGHLIKEYFLNLRNYTSDITLTTGSEPSILFSNPKSDDWKIHLIDTGDGTMTGGRLLRLRSFLLEEKAFFLTYGDGLGDINLDELLNFHQSHGGLATVTSVSPPGRFGAVTTENNGLVVGFHEKPAGDGLRINGGFFVLSPSVFDLIEGDQTVWEERPLQSLTKSRNLFAYSHSGFWRPMDNLSDKRELDRLWNEKKAPWKLW